uniref:ESF1 homolog n=1 Tax=Phallusia mammillata TaxID=59560 RepID=A0A6F9DD08_9ASCI|nr:ESF1 homolog [Phallusia mammillata]
MDLSKIDDRFKSVFHDRRFSSIRQRDKKVKIDNRFHSMFTDERFKLQYKVDKRGKPINETSSENLKKYYRLSKKDSHQLKVERKQHRQKLKNLLSDSLSSQPQTTCDDPNDNIISSKDKENSDAETDESSDESIDLARGEGNIETSSDEDDDFFEDTDAGNDEHWGEMDNDAKRSDETSSRLALCNMDWDRVKAVDLLVLFDSFKPPKGTVKKVTIYPSEFGVKQLKEEEEMGPQLKNGDEDGNHNEINDAKEGERFQVEKLRTYQINRLKYYYAVIECDSAQTADAIYQECDGMEFETTSNKIDLRFIPDDTTFDEHPPKDTSDHIPNIDEYKAPDFVTTALNQSKVDLTWDETDRKRLAVTMRKFTAEELENMDLKDFLASSSGSDEDDEAPPTTRIGISSKTTDADQIARYRSLLMVDDKEEKPNDIDMEITWEPLPDEVSESKSVSSDEEGEGSTEDDAVKTKQSRKRKKNESDKEETEESIQERAQLEMLMMDAEDATKKHFNIDEIVKEQQFSGKKKLKKQNNKEKTIDDFKINTSDDRFSALYTSSDFALDPNNPSFRKTKAMQELVEERQKRIAKEPQSHTTEKANVTKNSETKESSISCLVSSIKAKTKTQFAKNKGVKNMRT